MPKPKPAPISAAGAAEQTGYSKRTIQSAIAKGELKAHKLGDATSAYVIEQRDLDKWIAKRAAKASA